MPIKKQKKLKLRSFCATIGIISITKIIIYTTQSGKAPFKEWLEGLDIKTKAITRARIDRVRLGNFGDCKVLADGEGVSELRISFGAGYRVYFGRDGLALIILLIGGDKGSQKCDISKAKEYWRAYKELK